MKLGSLAAARPQYYDRNSVDNGANYSAVSIAPHTSTVRWTVTAASNKTIYVDCGLAFLQRSTVPTVMQGANCQVFVTPNGASLLPILTSNLLNSTVGSYDRATMTGSVLLKAGSNIQGITSDYSTGGDFTYIVTCHYTTFDA